MDNLDYIKDDLEEIKNRNNNIEKINEWKKNLDEDSFTLIVNLMRVKDSLSEDGVLKIRNLNKKYPNLNLNLNGLTMQMNAFTYYHRFESLIRILLEEYKEYSEEIKKEMINYYIFDNSLKELEFQGPAFRYNFKAKKRMETIYRITKNNEKDNELFNVIKSINELTIAEFMRFYCMGENSTEELNERESEERRSTELALEYLFNNKKSITERLIAFAVAQVNGSSSALPSYSKSLGIDLYKYAHGDCVLKIKKNSTVNCIKKKYEKECFSFQRFISNKNITSLKSIESFSIDFSEVRNNEMKNLNKWLYDFLGKENGICTYGTPILDRHVVSTSRPDENDIIVELSTPRLVILMSAYINILKKYNSKDDIILNEEIKSAQINVNNILEEIIKEIDESYSKAESKKEKFEALKSDINDVTQRDIQELIQVLEVVNWERETVYFWDFIRAKKHVEFLLRIEDSLVIALMKAMIIEYSNDLENKRG